MNYEITGISEPQLDKNGNNHIRLHTPSKWTVSENGQKTFEEGRTIFVYENEDVNFDDFEVGETITVK